MHACGFNLYSLIGAVKHSTLHMYSNHGCISKDEVDCSIYIAVSKELSSIVDEKSIPIPYKFTPTTYKLMILAFKSHCFSFNFVGFVLKVTCLVIHG